MKKIMFAVRSAKEAAQKQTAIIVSKVVHGKKDGAVNYLLEMAAVSVVIILAITAAASAKIDFSSIWSKAIDALGSAITKATGAFQ